MLAAFLQTETLLRFPLLFESKLYCSKVYIQVGGELENDVCCVSKQRAPYSVPMPNFSAYYRHYAEIVHGFIKGSPRERVPLLRYYKEFYR